MHPLTALILEDEPKSARLLCNLLQRHAARVSLAGVAATVEEGIAAVTACKPDILFLDIELPDGLGFDVLDQAPQPVPCVVVVSAFDAYALPAIKHGVTDYLLKPVDARELAALLARITTALKQEKTVPENMFLHDKITLPSFDGLLFVNLQDIIYCKSEGSYTRFYLAGKTEVLVSKNIGEYEALLPAGHFCRVHNMFLININHVKKYVRGRGGYIIMHNEASIEVSVRRKEAFLARLGRV